MEEPQAGRPADMSAGVVHVVAYLEVMPPSMGEATALLRQYREMSRADAGYVRLEVLQQRGRPDHFAILEGWQDQQAFETHATATHTRQFHEALRPLRLSPYDERPHQGLSMGAAQGARVEGATYVVTHADAIPSGKDEASTLLKQLAEATRGQDGCVRFEVWQQLNRPNHFTLVEIWRDQPARKAHAMDLHTRQFREQFQPLSGSLYDERVYLALN